MVDFQKVPYKKEEILSALHPLVIEWFNKTFKDFSEPQRFSIVNIHQRENTLISSPTGSGKTLSAFLSIISELTYLSESNMLSDDVHCIYISPLKALANDIEKNLNEPLKGIKEIAEKQGKKINVRVAIRTGDTSASEKSSMLKKTPHILITTPESLAIILCAPKFREKLRQVKWVIIDEIHAIASSKRGVHLSLSLERLQNLANFTRIGLSATVSPLEEIAKFLVGIEDVRKEKYRTCRIVDTQFIKKLDLKVLSPVENLVKSSHEEMHREMYELINNLVQSHKATLVFTNTRAATERVVHHLKDKFPKNYTGIIDTETGKIGDSIGAHHGSLSKDHRLNIENRLKQGKIRCVVCSTSLELGIDIGYIDLVILLGSPKSVARALQRIGRSGHKLHDEAKGRIIVLNRDDLVECSVLLKAALEKKIDKISVPQNCLDVLAQQIFGMAIEESQALEQVFYTIKRSYCYKNIDRKDFDSVISYLAGEYTTLEDRHVYAKIWHDKETGMIGKRGKMARVLYMTNIGTIPDEAHVLVKIGEMVIGAIDEGFLERLKRGDIFVLGGNSYEFLFSRGMTVQVKASVNRPPTVPSWFSETLPLSFDLALEIQRFRKLMSEKFSSEKSKKEILEFINTYLYVDHYGANSIYEYFREQYLFLEIPHEKKLLVEHYSDGKNKYVVFHSVYGRRVNDVLARALAFAVSRLQHKDVEISVTDNGFYLMYKGDIQVLRAFTQVKSKDLRKIMELALDNTEILKRRFRHCAARALMILRSYKGRERTVGRQQLSSMLLINAVKRISNDFPILKEARREVMEDLMDIDSAKIVLEEIEQGKIKLKEVFTDLPSPFAFNLVAEGYTDIMKIEDKVQFLQRVHSQILAKIALKEKEKEE